MQITRDPRINWIANSVHKRREARGLTSVGKQVRLIIPLVIIDVSNLMLPEPWFGQRSPPQPHSRPLNLEETQHSQPSSLSLKGYSLAFSYVMTMNMWLIVSTMHMPHVFNSVKSSIA